MHHTAASTPLLRHGKAAAPTLREALPRVGRAAKKHLDGVDAFASWEPQSKEGQEVGRNAKQDVQDYLALARDDGRLFAIFAPAFGDEAPVRAAGAASAYVSELLEKMEEEGTPLPDARRCEFASAMRKSSARAPLLIEGTLVPQGHRGVYSPASGEEIERDIRRLFLGPTGGEKATWSRLFRTLTELCTAASEACVEFLARLDTYKQKFSPALVKHSYSEQHYERIFLEGSDEQKNEVELDTEEKGGAGKRRQKRQRERQERKQKEQEDGAAEAPKARGHPELSQLSTTKSHAPGQFLFTFDAESRPICPRFQKMIKLCAAEAESHWALLCDGMWLLKGLRLLGLPFDPSKEQQTEQRELKHKHNTLGSLQQAMEAAAEKKQREEKDESKAEKTKDKDLLELRAENARLKSGELSSLRELLKKEEEAEAWKKQR